MQGGAPPAPRGRRRRRRRPLWPPRAAHATALAAGPSRASGSTAPDCRRTRIARPGWISARRWGAV